MAFGHIHSIAIEMIVTKTDKTGNSRVLYHLHVDSGQKDVASLPRITFSESNDVFPLQGIILQNLVAEGNTI